MGTITINVKDDVEKEFKETKIAERQIQLMRKGLYSLKGWKFNREGIYDRGL